MDLRSVEIGICEFVGWCLFIRCIWRSSTEMRNWDVDGLFVLVGIVVMMAVQICQIAGEMK